VAGGAGPDGGRAAARDNREEPRVAEVRAEMVANVWKVVAAEGAEVSDGDTLVILESMKMEIPVLSPKAGTIKEIRVSEGEAIDEGQLVAILDA
jgi:acetyl-CoA carboxylase biotin carboxyl carrier protein